MPRYAPTMQISAFLVISSVASVLSQAATVTTTDLVSITPAPSNPTGGEPQGLIGYSYVSQLSAC